MTDVSQRMNGHNGYQMDTFHQRGRDNTSADKIINARPIQRTPYTQSLTQHAGRITCAHAWPPKYEYSSLFIKIGLISGIQLNPTALASGPKFSFYVSTFIT